MKRIWFVQQQPFDFMPLKAGLNMITEEELDDYEEHLYPHIPGTPRKLCPKIYTTRTRPMKGEYQVVRGSRFKAVPLDPPIQFKVEYSTEFSLSELEICFNEGITGPLNLHKKYSVPELDLGLVGTTADDLRDELLKLNKKSTIDTPYYINKLEPL